MAKSRAWSAWLGFALFVGAVTGAVWCVRTFFTYVRAVPTDLGAALVAGTATVLVATFTVMLGRYFERKRELDALYRDKKTEVYDAFLKKFFALTAGESDASGDEPIPDLVNFLREFTRTLILWSGPGVINAFLAWKEHLAKGVPDAQTIFLTEKLLLAIREDLGHSNSRMSQGFFARIYLRESGLFMALAIKDPSITLAELSELEKKLTNNQPA